MSGEKEIEGKAEQYMFESRRFFVSKRAYGLYQKYPHVFDSPEEAQRWLRSCWSCDETEIMSYRTLKENLRKGNYVYVKDDPNFKDDPEEQLR